MFGERRRPGRRVAAARAAAIRQRAMRSESDGHCCPTSFPGLAAREAARRRDLAPLVLSVCDRYRPTVAEFLRHVDELRARSAGTRASGAARIERVRAVDGGFELDSHGVFRHVLLAPGHPGLAVPPELERDPRVVHAYQPHGYASRVAVVGAGMAAATEWLNALAAGRRGRLGAPARAGAAAAERPAPALHEARARRLPRARRRAERAELLRRFAEPSYPPGRAWDAPIERATREGRFRVGDAELERRRSRSSARPASGAASSTTRCSAGSSRSTASRRRARWIVLAADSTRPGAHRPHADALARRRPGPVGLPGRRHARRDEVRGAALPAEDRAMSYTLRGRVETRLAAALLPFAVAAVLAPDPARLVAARARRADDRHRARARRARSTTGCSPTSPAGSPLPLGLLELGLIDGRGPRCSSSARRSGPRSPSSPASWLVMQVLAHAGLPLLRLTWPEDGGELGRAGLGALGRRARRARSPCSARRGPSSRRRSRSPRASTRARSSSTTRSALVGEPGAVVRGGIVITADDVTVRDLTDPRRRVRDRGRRRARAWSWTTSSSRAPSSTASTSAAASRRDPRLRDPLAAGRVHAGDRHLVRLRPRAEPRRALHDHRRPRGHRHPLRARR